MNNGIPLPPNTVVMLWRSWMGVGEESTHLVFSVCVSLHPQRGDCGDCVVPGHLAHQASKHGYSVVMCPQDRHLHTHQTIHLFWVSCKSFQPHVEGLFLNRFALGALLLEAPTWTSFRAATGPPMLLEPLEATMSIGGDGSILRRFSSGKVAIDIDRGFLNTKKVYESLGMRRGSRGSQSLRVANFWHRSVMCFFVFFCVCQYVL